MLLRVVLILALLTQQLAVWPCLAVCRMAGGCVDLAPCLQASTGGNEGDASEACASSCEAACGMTCGDAGEDACAENSCEDSRPACVVMLDCDAVCYLACAAASSQSSEQGQPPAPAPTHVDLMTLLALPVAFIAPVDPFQSMLDIIEPQRASRAAHIWPASQQRSLLCCWII